MFGKVSPVFRGMLGVFIAVVLLAGGVFLSGCNSGPSPEEQKRAELTEQLLGKWEAVGENWSSVKKLGLRAVFSFEEDGTAALSMYLKGTEMSRVGSWEIVDGQVLVDLPAMEAKGDGSGPLKSMSASAVDDAPVVLEADSLKVDLGGGEQDFSKMSESDFEALVTANEALKPVQLAVGETVSTDACTFAVTSVEYLDEVYPQDTSGYYRYLPDESDKTYVVAWIDFTNNGTEYGNPDPSTQAAFSIAGNSYEADVYLYEGSILSRSFSLDPKEGASLLVVSSVPDSVLGSGESKFVWKLPKAVNGLQNYFNENGDNVTYEMAF